MKLPQLKNQKPYATCDTCQTQRPVDNLTDGKCNDGWCVKQAEVSK